MKKTLSPEGEAFLRQKRFTRAEREVAVLYLNFATIKEIASAHFTAEQTVKFHGTNIFKKLGVKNRNGVMQVLMPYVICEGQPIVTVRHEIEMVEVSKIPAGTVPLLPFGSK